MSLKTVDTDELTIRFSHLSDQFNDILKSIGPNLEKMGRISKEMTIIKEELQEREDV